jgi:hypothetical protein
MGRPTYVCATCEEHFTRKYGAKRHNLTIHNGRGEIVTLLEYLVGRLSGRYRPSHPSLYRRMRGQKRIRNFGDTATVSVDSMRDTFRPGGLQQQQTPSLQPIQPTAQISPKIRELKKLMQRYPIFPNPDMIIQCVIHFSMNGDNSFLDEKLEQLRWLDSAMAYVMPR